MIRELAGSAAVITTNLPPSQFYTLLFPSQTSPGSDGHGMLLLLLHSCVHHRGASVHMDGDDTVDGHPRNFFNRFRHGRRRL